MPRKIFPLLALSILLNLWSAAPALSAAAPPSGASWLGDANDDGSLDVFDLLALLKALSGSSPASERQRLLANVDKSADGKIDVFDLLALLKLLSGAAQPEALYWGPPSLAEVSPPLALAGDTLELTFQNMRGSVPLRLYLRDKPVEFISVEGSRARFVVPDSFIGGNLTVVSGSDSLGSRFLNVRNTNVHTIAGCRIFPYDNAWNQSIEAFPVHRDSDKFIAAMSYAAPLHPDMVAGDIYGMPYTVVGGDQPRVPMTFNYADESDPGPYPVPDNTKIEGGPNADPGSDRHTLVLDSTNCKLYEVFHVFRDGPGWTAGGGCIFDLNSNALRPDGWTSADAAGLSILAGVVQYDEVASGEVNHAIRFTMDYSQRAYVYPATHFASSRTDPYLAPMGLRVRLKSSYFINKFTGQARVIARALQKYGMLMADNGGDWFFTGGVSRKWNNNELDQLKAIIGLDFEVVDTDQMQVSGRTERYNIRPGSEITFPPPDTTFAAGDSIPVTVKAWDNDGSVARVEYFRDSVKLGESAAAPYRFTWQEAAPGDYVLSARATDNGGLSNTSWGIHVTVQ